MDEIDKWLKNFVDEIDQAYTLSCTKLIVLFNFVRHNWSTLTISWTKLITLTFSWTKLTKFNNFVDEIDQV